MTQQRNQGLDALKALGALLIINSHLEEMYPRPWLSLDGMMGNTIFFFTTGFSLAGSLERRLGESLGSFLWKRVSRMYPALWAALLLLPPRGFDWNSAAAAAREFLYPTPFTFVKTILPIYPFFFLLMRLRCGHLALMSASAVLICCATALGVREAMAASSSNESFTWSLLGDWVWTPYFAAAMLAGSAMQRGRLLEKKNSFRSIFVAWLLMAACYLFFRFAATGSAPDGLAAAVRPLLIAALPSCLAVAVLSLRLFCAPPFARWLGGPAVAAAVGFLSVHTWETYVMHQGIARWPLVSRSPFPFDVALVFILTLALAPILRLICSPSAPLAKLRK